MLWGLNSIIDKKVVFIFALGMVAEWSKVLVVVP